MYDVRFPNHRTPRSPRAISARVVIPTLVVASVAIIGSAFFWPHPWIIEIRAWALSGQSNSTTPPPLHQLERELARAREEVQHLQEIVQLRESERIHRWTIKSARIIGESVQPSLSLVFLDKGSADGIQVGMPVVVDGVVIVGTIVDVDTRTSAVLALTHPRSRIAVAVQNTDRTIGVLQGNANLSLELLLVPRSEALQRGQTVITSGIQSLIPRGLFVGVIGYLDTNPANIFLEATVTAAAELRRASTVGVITGNQ